MEVCSTGLLFGERSCACSSCGGGYVSVSVWVVGSRLAVSGHEVLVGIEIGSYFKHSGK